MSRLERARQRALLAKSITENSDTSFSQKVNLNFNEDINNDSKTKGFTRSTNPNQNSDKGNNNSSGGRLASIALKSLNNLNELKKSVDIQPIRSDNKYLENIDISIASELSSNLKLGLGTPVPPQNSSPDEQNWWDCTHRALSKESVIYFFVFLFYWFFLIDKCAVCRF
jgi:hypothetical protein